MKMVVEGADAIPNITEGVYPMELYIRKDKKSFTVYRSFPGG